MYKKRLLNLLFFFAIRSFLFGQCNVIRNIPVVDYDTTIISIVVDSLVNDTMGENGQGLCGVGIDFRHEFIGDITMELVSPDGTTVTLIGPSAPVSGNTSFTRWNINFVPCGQLPSPDPGFSDIWDNLQPWGVFGNYIGQYYPIYGCLEDFNGGNANGVWSLRIIDVSQFGSGRIQGLMLFFCDDTGINCNECRLDPGRLSGPSIEQCQSGSGVNLSGIMESFTVYPKDTSVYNYLWAIFNDTSLIDVVPQDTLLHLPAGNFKICNLQQAKIETDLLPELPLTMNVEEINHYFQDALTCAKMGDSCLEINIFPSTDTMLVDTSICKDTKLYLYGDTIAEPGVYTYSIQGEFCDSVVVLTVVQNEFKVSIAGEKDTLGCFLPVLELTGLVNGERSPDALFLWTTGDGRIISDPTVDSILINLPGLYFVEAISGTCSGIDSVHIYQSDSLPKVEILGADTLTCQTDTLILSILANEIYDTIKWYSASPFISGNNHIKVYEAGIYKAEIITTEGCRGFAYTEIIKIETVPPFFVQFDSLVCGKDTSSAKVIHETGGSFSYVWTGTLPAYQNSSTVRIVQGGVKSLVVTDNFSGCSAVYAFELPDLRVYATGEVIADTITCSKDSAEVKLILDMEVDSYLWQGPGLSSMDTAVIIGLPGEFSVDVITNEGCVTSIPFEIVADTLQAEIMLSADSLSCSVDSVTILVESDMVLNSFTWFDRYGFIVSSDADPWVHIPGIYTLQAENSAGCITVASVEIVKASELPEINFIFEILSCKIDSVQIIPDRTEGLWFTWEFPDFSKTNVPSPFVEEAGKYKVTITDAANPSCVVYDEILIEDKSVYPVVNITHGQLTCFQDSALVEISISPEESNYYITGPVFYAENLDRFHVASAGLYEVVAISSSGCESKDTFFINQDFKQPEITRINASEINCTSPFSILGVDILSPVDSVVWVRPDGFRFTGNTFQSNLPGRYEIKIYGKNGCIKDTFANVIENVVLPSFSVIADSLTCSKDTAILKVITADSTISYIWTGPEQFFSASQQVLVTVPGPYTLVVTNDRECRDTLQIEVKGDYKIPEFNIQDTFLVPCDSSFVLLELIEKDSINAYYWTFEGVFLSVDPYIYSNKAGNYSVQVTGNNGCKSTKDFKLIQVLKPVGFTVQTDTIRCNKPVANLRAEARDTGVIYTWITPSNQFLFGPEVITSDAGLFKLIVQDKNICYDTVEVMVVADTMAFMTEIWQNGVIVCNQREVILGVQDSIDSATYTYRWFNNGGSILSNPELTEVKVRDPGLYRFIAVNQLNGCSGVSIKMVEESESFFKEIPVAVKQPPCKNFNFGSVVIGSLDGIPPYMIELNGAKYSNVFDFQFLQPGEFRLTVTDSIGCKIDTVFRIESGADPAINLPSDTTLVLGDTLVIDLDSVFWKANGYSIQLFEKNNLICDDNCIFPLVIQPGVATVFTLRFETGDNLCFFEHQIFVNINENIFSSIPNVISRNALLDENKRFIIPETSGIKEIISLEIYDKWANPMFASYNVRPGNVEQGWDGKVQGKDVQSGVYVVICKLLLSNDRIVTYMGDVTILE